MTSLLLFFSNICTEGWWHFSVSIFIVFCLLWHQTYWGHAGLKMMLESLNMEVCCILLLMELISRWDWIIVLTISVVWWTSYSLRICFKMSCIVWVGLASLRNTCFCSSLMFFFHFITVQNYTQKELEELESFQHSQSTVGFQMFQNLYVPIFMCRFLIVFWVVIAHM